MADSDEHIVDIVTAHVDDETISGVEWMRRGDARRICGIGKDTLDTWVLENKVAAHKLHSGKNGTVIFSAKDIRRAIESSPKYLPSQRV